MKNLILLTIFVVGLAGCASNSPQDLRIGKALELTHHIYGKLENTDAGFRFTSFSDGYSSSGAWVRMSDFRPMWKTGRELCRLGFPLVGEACNTGDKELFRDEGLNFTIGSTVGYIIVSAFTFGVGALSPPGEVVFNWDHYLDAIDEASKKLKGETKEGANRYEKTLVLFDSVMDAYESSFDRITREYDKKPPAPEVTLIDKSGLYKGTSEYFRKLIVVERNIITKSDALTGKYIDSLDNLVKIANERNQAAINNLIQKTSFFMVRCDKAGYLGDANYLGNAKYSLSCPSKVSSENSRFKAEAIVHSINYRKLFPVSFQAVDKNITLTSVDGAINIANKTDSFVTIESMSFYHNGKVATLHKMSIELPPGSEKVITRISALPIVWDRISFLDVTKMEASRKKIEYGFAVKYKVVDTDREKTLLKIHSYRLVDLIALR